MMNFLKGFLIGPIIILAIIVLYFFYRKIKRSKMERIAAEQEHIKQIEAQKRIDQMDLEREEEQKRIQAIHDQHNAEIEAAIIAAPGSEKYHLDKMQTEVSAKTLNITEFTPISKSRYIAFDLETTGLNYDSDAIVEIGAVLVENGVIIKEYHQMVDPERLMPADAAAVNHITDEMLAGQPKIHQVLPSFLTFVGDEILAAHYAPFDIRFLCQACMRNRFRIPVGFFDTLELARYWPEAQNKKLVTLASTAGIQIDNAHRALSDARAVAEFIAATNTRRAESRKKKNTAENKST